jgi:hypothetical protein
VWLARPQSWDVERVTEWPWLSGIIRAVSHTNVTKKDLKNDTLEPFSVRSFERDEFWLCYSIEILVWKDCLETTSEEAIEPTDSFVQKPVKIDL